MRTLLSLLVLMVFFIGCKNNEKKEEQKAPEKAAISTEKKSNQTSAKLKFDISPISHATAVLKWDATVIYLDPVGGAAAFESSPRPDFVLITDVHGDHMSAETLQELELGDTRIIVPQAVKEKLPKELQKNLLVMKNGENQNFKGFNIKAVPMYNLPQSEDAMHVKGRGNGYVLEKNGKRVYISGDTEDIDEMRALKNIDLALICMNLPYTMTVEQAADAVLEFKPKKVIPYHYRGKNGFSDVEKFKKLVNNGDKQIEVELLEWYPEKNK